MQISKINQVLTPIEKFPELSKYNVQQRHIYAEKVEYWLGIHEQRLVSEVNTLSTEINTSIDGINTAITTLENFTTTNTQSEAKAKEYMDTTLEYRNTTQGYMNTTEGYKNDAQSILNAFSNVQLNGTQVNQLFEQFGQQISWQRKVIADDVVAQHNDFLFIDTTTKVINVTLPNAQDGLRVRFIDAKSNFNTNKLTIIRNGGKIMGLSEDMEVMEKNINFELVCQSGDWRIA